MTNNIPELLQKITFGSDHFWNRPHVQLATVPDKNSWDTSTQPCFFFLLLAHLLVLPMLFFAVKSKSCTPTLGGQEDSVPTISTETVPSIFKVIFLT